MRKVFRLSAIFCWAIMFASNLYGQQWVKTSSKYADSVYAIYGWEAHDNYHSAYGEMTLTKSGRYKYLAHWPLNYNEVSVGTYKIVSRQLILTSDLQSDNVKVEISYVDTATTDTLFNCLDIPTNNKGELITNCYYRFNHDTANKMKYDPLINANRELLRTMTSIKLGFWDADFGSDWIPVLQNNQFISVKILTDDNYHEYKPRVFKAWRFKMNKNKLIEIAKE